MARIFRTLPDKGESIAIAFSGGLDTRCAVAWLAKHMLAVHAVARAGVEQRAQERRSDRAGSVNASMVSSRGRPRKRSAQASPSSPRFFDFYDNFWNDWRMFGWAFESPYRKAFGAQAQDGARLIVESQIPPAPPSALRSRARRATPSN